LEGTREVPDDGLPVTLAETIAAYEVRKFKIKIAGDIEEDTGWVQRVLQVLDERCDEYAVTLDANEQYASVAKLRSLIDRLEGSRGGSSVCDRLLFVEQPFPREIALSQAVGRELKEWGDRPPVIIDESDRLLRDGKRALNLGYAGTSYKGCKGVFKGLANACIIEARRRSGPREKYILSAEDLTTIGPISLMQDLAVIGTLGITHAERNGHHFIRGLEPFGPEVQEAARDAHKDLYRRHDRGFVTLDIANGRVDFESALSAPFGYDVTFDTLVTHSRFDNPDYWQPPF
jgi:hypothetical protein